MAMRTSTKLVLGAVVAATIVVLGRRKLPSRRIVWPDAGSVAGYSYVTYHAGGATPRLSAPVVVLLHGRGGSQEAIAGLLVPNLRSPAHVIVPKGKNKGPMWWPGRAADEDQNALAAQMAWTVEDFRPFLDAVMAAYGRKPIVAGHSQGGMFASALALQEPDRIAKAVGSAAWVPKEIWSTSGAPIALVHGTSDETIPYQRTAAWVEDERSRGAPITLDSVEGGHQLSGPLLSAWLSAVGDAIAGRSTSA